MWNTARVTTRYLYLGRDEILYVVSADWVYVCRDLSYDRILQAMSTKEYKV